MDERRARIHDDLRGVLEGGLILESVPRAAYALDANLFEVDPLGVVVPRTVADVVHTMKYAAENGLPVHARGAGTAAAGAAIGPGLVIDFSRYLRRVVEVQAERVVVQPGVVLDELNVQLAPLGRRIGPDPLGSEVATVGGLLAIDAAGPSALRYGSIGDHLERARVVFASGETAELGPELWPAYDDEPTDLKGLIVRKLGALVRRNLDLLVQHAPRTPRYRPGYALARAASGVGIHLPRLIAGSQGTLVLTTELTLRTVPLPQAQVVLLLPFGPLADAAAAAIDAPESSPAACELFDWRLLRLAREAGTPFRGWIAEAAESALILLFEGDDPDEVRARAGRFSQRVARTGRLTADPVLTTRRADCERLMHLRRAIEPILMRLKGRARPIDALVGLTVPPAQLPEMVLRLQNIMKERDVSWALDAHAADGRLHVRPFLDLSDPADRAKLERIATDVFEAALALGGSAPVEVLAGTSGPQFLRRQFGELLPVYRGVKDAFDPQNLLNPGCVVSDDSRPATRDYRVPLSVPPVAPEEPGPSGEVAETNGTTPAVVPVLLPLLRWVGDGLIETASGCTACGLCRTREPSGRMCPSFRALRDERATPRALANLVNQLATGRLDPKLWGSEEFKESASLCTHCKLCPTECPAGVDVSTLMIEAKAAYVETHGLPPGDWALSRLELWARVASRLPILTNMILASRPTRWLLERLVGLSRRRRLPKVHRTPFVSRAARQGLHKPRSHEPGPRVAYFVDVFANYIDQEIGESVVGVLREAGVNVYVPRGQRGSGMPAWVAGDIDHARELALANLRVLGDAVRDGYTVVCSEPTAALMIRQEYLKLTDDLDADLVAANTYDVGQYLAGLDARGQLPPPSQPLRARIGYHQPCHLRALQVGTPGLDLVRRIPEVEVEFIDRGCSGMAGTFGLHRDNFMTSLRAGRGLLSRLRDGDLDLGATECSACRVQMEQGTLVRTLHPVTILGLGYGLNSSLRHRLKEPKPRRQVH